MQVNQNNNGQQPFLPADVLNATTLELMQQSLQIRMEKLWLDAEETLTLFKTTIDSPTLPEKLQTLSQEAVYLGNEMKIWRSLQKLL